MMDNIQGILFDMGGTLRRSVKPSPVEAAAAIRRITDLLGTEIEVDEIQSLLRERGRKYHAWAQSTLNELNEQDLWVNWMLPDWPAEIIRPIAVQLNEAFRDSYSKRIVFDETVDVIVALFRRGYRLGLVSNTTSSVEIPEVLRRLMIRGYFDVILMSALEGKRKPDERLLRDAAERMGLAPHACAYVGDQPGRDVAAAQKAGYSEAIILKDPQTQSEVHEPDPDHVPDHVIGKLTDLLDLFPRHEPYRPARRFRASLSTMWAGKNFISLSDFFEFAARAGFGSVELNHKVTSAMLAEVDLDHFSISSIHEPCPADTPVDVLVRNDWLISSLDEDNRRAGVNTVLRSIDLARRCGASTIVIHSGIIQSMDGGMEKQLSAWVRQGRKDSSEFIDLQARMIAARQKYAPGGMASLRKSLRELLDYAAPLGVRLGLENRAHYREFPNPDEMAELFELEGLDRLGFIFDVGHAMHLDRLGFYPLHEWLERFSGRIFGTHLHDVIGLNDHFAAGLGEVQFNALPRYLPGSAFRTCEFLDSNTPQQVKAGVQFLFDHGCIGEL